MKEKKTSKQAKLTTQESLIHLMANQLIWTTTKPQIQTKWMMIRWSDLYWYAYELGICRNQLLPFDEDIIIQEQKSSTEDVSVSDDKEGRITWSGLDKE
jgi:hypothetical protein